MKIKDYIEENFPEKEFIESGFFKKGMTIDEKKERICKFFGLKSIFEYSHLPPFGNGLFHIENNKAVKSLKINEN